MTNNLTRIAFSGKKGAGKDTQAVLVMNKLFGIDTKKVHSSFAVPLKDQLTDLMRGYDSKYDRNPSVEEFAEFAKTSSEHAGKLLELLKDVNPVEDTGYTRTEGIRELLKYLGTEVRRGEDPKYWVNLWKKEITQIPEGTPVYITDCRFWNEAEGAKEIGFVIVRLEVKPEIIARRIFERDGIVTDLNEAPHLSETELDNYPKFDVVYNNDHDDAEKASDDIVASLRKLV